MIGWLYFTGKAGIFGFVLIGLLGWWRGWHRAKIGLWAGLWWGFMLASVPLMHPPGAVADWRGFWGAFGVLGALVALYAEAVRRLRARARPAPPPAHSPPAHSPPAAPFAPEELDRYARHLFLHDIGGPGQQRLKAARVLVVGAGGLGSPALLYLAASGVGTLGVVDDDLVALSNLQRQILHTTAQIGRPKVFSAAAAVAALNPHVTLRPWNRRLDESSAAALIAEHDIVLDGSDNFDTRELVNRECARAGKPLVAGALGQWEGQLSVWDPARGAPCAACVFPARPAPGLVPSCAEAGVAAPLPGILGAMMAAEAVKLITGAGTPLRGRLMIHDALHAETRVIAVKRRPDCPVCGSPVCGGPAPA